MLYWATGNPWPNSDDRDRGGDNLFTDSVLALDPATGKMKWYYQFTPHDTHDWDAAHVPMLVDATVNGKARKLIVNPNRNAFYYVLDRVTGEFLAGREYAKQTWAKGLDDKGRPVLVPEMDPTEEGKLVWPALNGATIWFSPSYSPKTKLFYQYAREMSTIFYRGQAKYITGQPYTAGGGVSVPAHACGAGGQAGLSHRGRHVAGGVAYERRPGFFTRELGEPG